MSTTDHSPGQTPRHVPPPRPQDKSWQTQFWHRVLAFDGYAYLDSLPWFKPTLLVVLAALVGWLLGPDLIIREQALQGSLEGTPATENVKAAYDFEVVDDESTRRLKDEAAQRVGRVYDFDVMLGQKAAQRLSQAFVWMREQQQSVDAKQYGDSRDNLWRQEFERMLGVSCKPDEFLAFKAAHFSHEVAQAAEHLLLEFMRQPMITGHESLLSDVEYGIWLQRVPADGKPQLVKSLDMFVDLETARAKLIAQALAWSATTGETPLSLRRALGNLTARLLEPNVSLNRAQTESQRADARDAIKPVTVMIRKGEMIIRDGERLTRRHLLVLETMHQNSQGSSFVLVALGGAVILLILVLTASGFASGYGRFRLRLGARDLLFLTVLFVGGIAASRLWLAVVRALHDSTPRIPLDFFVYMLPVAAGTMLVRLVLRADVSLLFALISSLILGILGDSQRMLGLFSLVGSVTATSSIRTISARGDVLRAGVSVGVVQMATFFGIHLFAAHTQWRLYAVGLLAAFLSGILASFITLALTPLVEWVFNYTTDLKLLELSNLNHPALKELIVQAPGSYHHSIIVGALVEAAAASVGANPLLARVMAYYHDLGKGCNPGYFIENQRTGQNPHDKLKPSMSAMVIRRHVTDGIELAKHYRLGEPILAGIAQHHGTTLIHYFFHKAKELAAENDEISEAEYRYPGQKPQSREAALVMLGDSIEAASRSLSDPTAARLQGLVNRIISHKFTDGQLDECDLTLRDLHTIAKSFSSVLNSIYHERPEYPEILKDISGKKHSGDTDTKPPRRPEVAERPDPVDPPDNLRRLGL